MLNALATLSECPNKDRNQDVCLESQRAVQLLGRNQICRWEMMTLSINTVVFNMCITGLSSGLLDISRNNQFIAYDNM